MDKKSTSKFRKFLNKKLIQKSKVILLGIVIASLFLPIITGFVNEANAADCNIKWGTQLVNGRYYNDGNARVAGKEVSGDFYITKDALFDMEDFEAYIDVKLDKDTGEACKKSGKEDYEFYLDSWSDVSIVAQRYGKQGPYKAKFYERDGVMGFEAGIKDRLDLRSFTIDNDTSTEYSLRMYAWMQRASDRNWDFRGPAYDYIKFVRYKFDVFRQHTPEDPIKPDHPVVRSIPDYVGKSGQIVNPSASQNADSVPFSDLDFALRIASQKEDKFRNFYRVTFDSGGFITVPTKPENGRKDRGNEIKSFSEFDSSGGIQVEMALGPKNSDSKIQLGSTTIAYSNLGKDYEGLTWLSGSPHTLYSIKTVSVSEKSFQDTNTCAVSKFSTSQYFCSGEKVKSSDLKTEGYVRKDEYHPYPFRLNQALALAGLKLDQSKTSPQAVNVLPTIELKRSWTEFIGQVAVGSSCIAANPAACLIVAGAIGTPSGFTYAADNKSSKILKLYFEVYPTKADLESHKDDVIPQSVPEYSDVVTGNTESGGPKSALDALFDLINKIVGYIVLLITNFIYWVFGRILLPVIVALIQVHPYKDDFVNFIYPGWIIIRNISNIFFIIALLYMGLKILVGLQDSGKTRGFIVNLILMALLVNFSLVIMQSVVAIADTVQAQFLPVSDNGENTQVIESLANKLMVDPIVIFNAGKLEAGKQTGESYASDIPKAIVLLVLAVAAFFSFVALIAFMFVRLVALWLLYMLSPLAYVGRILPETQGAANKYWSQLFTYAFNVPILAFFLNIAALMAVTFSAQTGDQVQVQGARGYLLGSAAAGMVEYALTVVSHFIVLVFIYFGMLYAQKFGGYGADKIVSFAKSGFDFVTKKAPKAVGMWAKDNVGEYLANTQKEKRPRLAAAISAATQPVLTGKKLAQRLWTDPKKAQMERMEEMRRPIDEYAKRAGMNKVQAMKMLGWKLAGKSAKRVQGRSDEYAQVMTDDERVQAAVKLGSENAELANLKNGITSGLTQITLEQAEIYQKELEKKIKEFQQKESDQLSGLEAKRAKAAARGDTQEEQRLKGEIDVIKANNDPERNRLRDRKDDIDSIIKAEAGNPPDTLVDPIDAKDALTLNAEHVQAKIADLDEKIDNDDLRRKKLGIENWNDYDRASVTKGMENIIRNRQFPEAEKQLVERLAAEAEQGKKYNDIDDPDVLQEVYKKALENNNVLLATAMAKKLFKMGYSKDLLSEHGFKNNIDGLKKFLGSMVKGAPVVVQNQIANELSNAAGEGGNRALHKAVSMNSEGQLGWNSKAEQFAKLSKTAGKKNVWEKKMNEMFYEDENGETQFLPGEADELKKISKNTEKHKQIRRAMPSSVAAEILKQEAAGKINLGALRQVIVDARGQI